MALATPSVVTVTDGTIGNIAWFLTKTQDDIGKGMPRGGPVGIHSHTLDEC